MSIPIYGFHRSNIQIDIEKSRHMYNNDLIYNQIEMLPIYDVSNYFDLENPEVFLAANMKDLFGNFLPEKYTEEETKPNVDHNKKIIDIDINLNVTNNTSYYRFVNTHDITLRVDGKISDSYKKKRSICILVLKPNEIISLRATANISISKVNAIYEATTNAILREINPTTYELEYETLGQLDKNLIFTKACIILIKKLEYLNVFIEKKYTEPIESKIIEIQLYGEDHTLGNLLATALQKCSYVLHAGYVMPHPFSDQITITYKLKPEVKKSPIWVFIRVIKYLIRLMESINNSSYKQKK
jgi:DNA-directed RNA polymerase subunit L